MVDRRIRYINPNGKIPPPGGGNQLLEELKAPALSDLQKERLLAMRSLTVEERPVVAAGKSTPGMSLKMRCGFLMATDRKVSRVIPAWFLRLRGWRRSGRCELIPERKR